MVVHAGDGDSAAADGYGGADGLALAGQAVTDAGRAVAGALESLNGRPAVTPGERAARWRRRAARELRRPAADCPGRLRCPVKSIRAACLSWRILSDIGGVAGTGRAPGRSPVASIPAGGVGAVTSGAVVRRAAGRRRI